MTRIFVTAIATVALLLSVAGCGGGTARTRPSPASKLIDLRDIGQLRSLFNARSGEPRLIVLVSPT